MRQSERPPSVHGEPDRPADWSNQRWDEFFDRHRRPLYRVITRNQGLSREHHDEVYADTCSALWMARGRLDPNRPVFPFACRISLNTARTRIRRLASSRRGRTIPLKPEHQAADHRRSGLDHEVGEERQHAVRQYLEALSPTARVVLESRGLDRLKWDEVAARARLPRTTVVRLYRSIVAEARFALAAWAS